MNLNLKKTALAALLLAVALPGQAAKPVSLVETNASFTVLSSKDPFRQEFLVKVATDYPSGLGSIFVTASSQWFKAKPMGFTLYSMSGSDLTGTISANVQAGSLVSSFVDSDFAPLDLEGGKTYRLVVSGEAKKDNVSFDIKGTYFSQISAVPELESYAMWLAGLGLIGAVVRRRTGG